MMQLIVLGQIPGTHLQLTFAWFQVIIYPVLAVLSYKLYEFWLQKQVTIARRHFDVISLQNLDQA